MSFSCSPHSSTSFPSTSSGSSITSGSSYISLKQPLRAQPRSAASKAPGAGHRHVLSAPAALGRRVGTGAAKYESTGEAGLTSASVSSGSSTPASEKTNSITKRGSLPANTAAEGNEHSIKAVKGKKGCLKAFDFTYRNVYTTGGARDGYRRARVGSGSGAPTGCLVM
ncbi:hypothetical protein MMC08_000251 [Hypocenomyce scalaris]|nr:hypothetical protein [Hypocenomyce scalaris]